jgi:membrane-associated phospholipid phosphatase
MTPMAEPRRLGRLVAPSRLLPRGPLDLVLQFAVLAAAYTAWRYARGAVHGDTVAEMGAAFAHARDLIDIQNSLGLLFEPGFQSWALDTGWPSEVARWGYVNLHFKGACLLLLTIYFVRPGSFPFVRNMVLAGMAISLLGYAFYPTAPPRFIGELGLDPSVAVTGNEPLRLDYDDPLYNPFAAVPSMHVGLALILAWSLALLLSNRVLKAALFAYPLLMAFVVIASGNHFWLDAVLGAVTAALAAGVAMLLARLRPEWSFRAEVPPPEPNRAEPEPKAEAAAA